MAVGVVAVAPIDAALEREIRSDDELVVTVETGDGLDAGVDDGDIDTRPVVAARDQRVGADSLLIGGGLSLGPKVRSLDKAYLLVVASTFGLK